MYGNLSSCGCWHPLPAEYGKRQYLPLVDLSSSTTILSTTSRTTLKQVFVNTSNSRKLEEVRYTFPLYDGVSVVGFTATVASRTIVGVVKEKQQARKDYAAAVERGETAGLFEQLPEASDVFTTKIGNVPALEKVIVEIVYLGELKHDAETDGSRFTIPTVIAPRYGAVSHDSHQMLAGPSANAKGGIKIQVDVALEAGIAIRGLQSPSHPIAVTMGRTSAMHEDAYENHHASATLTLGSTELDKDFVIVVLAKGQDTPRALLEAHSTIPNQHAIMATLVPKFNLPNGHPEIVFVVDRSGSMASKIELLVDALKIFLKSLPVGVKFNIISFGSSYQFLFKKSKTYDESSVKEALDHVKTFGANFGGTEMLEPIKAVVDNRFKNLPLEVMVLTDGEIWNQDEMFTFLNQAVKSNARFFSLGIGSGASSSLVEGIARAGDGFAQFVGDGEKMDKRVVRMLKGALTPHINEYTLEVKYGAEDMMTEDDFEVVESFQKSTKVVVTEREKPKKAPPPKKISLFNIAAKEEPTNPDAGRYDHLPAIAAPKLLQAPFKIPSLYPFNRTTVYLLLGPDACQRRPTSVVLRAESEHGPLELEIPVQDIGSGETLHQLAAKKAIHELEQGRGWLTVARDEAGTPLNEKYEGDWDTIVEREAVRLGVQFQVGGKWCSFVAVEKNASAEARPDGELPAYSPNQADGQAGGHVGDYQRRAGPVGSQYGKLPSFHDPFKSPFVERSRRAALLAQPQPTWDRKVSNVTQGSGSLFGSQNSTFGRPAAAGGVGASRQQTQGSSLFAGAPSTNQISYPAGGLFGSSNNPQRTDPQMTSGLFGFRNNTQQTSLFPQPRDRNISLFDNSKSAAVFPAGTNRSDLPAAQYHDGCHQFSGGVESHGSQAPSNNNFTGGLFATLTPDTVQTPSVSCHKPYQDRDFRMAPSDFQTSHVDPTSLDDENLGHADNVGTTVSFGSRSMQASQIAPSSFATAPATIRQRVSGKLLGMGPPPPAPAGPGSPAPFGESRRKSKKMASKAPRMSPVMRAAAKPKSAPLHDKSEESCEDESEAMEGTTARTTTDEEKMHEIIEMQEFDGSWKITDALLSLYKVSKDQVQAVLGAGGDEKIHGTALAIAWLQSKVSDEAEVWEMVVDKARAWLISKIGNDDFDDMIRKAKTIV